MLRRARPWLGTIVEIAAEARQPRALAAGLDAAFAAVARVHRALSVHLADSEISRVNRRAHAKVQAISTDLRTVLECALELGARSADTFDPTVGGHVAALGFLPPQGSSDPEASWRNVELTSRGVRYTRPLILDFGGIAKGYAVDCAVGALREHGVTAGRVNAGGDLRMFGTELEPVHVRTGGPKGIVVPLLALTEGAVATSSYGTQRRRVRGRWASPLIDPRAHLPVMSTRTVSVVAPTCIVADALTKVVALRGAAASPLLAAYGAAASILTPAGGRWRCTLLPRPQATRDVGKRC